jgi:hypothetical protein
MDGLTLLYRVLFVSIIPVYHILRENLSIKADTQTQGIP